MRNNGLESLEVHEHILWLYEQGQSTIQDVDATNSLDPVNEAGLQT